MVTIVSKVQFDRVMGYIESGKNEIIVGAGARREFAGLNIGQDFIPQKADISVERVDFVQDHPPHDAALEPSDRENFSSNLRAPFPFPHARAPRCPAHRSSDCDRGAG